MLILFFQFACGFFLLWRGGHYLIEGAGSIAKRLHVPDLLVGLTLVAFGTSLPELCVNMMAVFKNKSDIIFGNVLGSNIANILLILGIAGIIKTLPVHKMILKRDMPVNVGAVLALLGCVYLISPSLNIYIGIIFLVSICIYIYMVYIKSEKHPPLELPQNHPSLRQSVIWVILGIICLPFGAKFVVSSVSEISILWGLSEAFISLFLVAFGTSLPELATCIVAAKKHKPGFIFGNIIGSNIFNIFMILGITAMIRPLYFNKIFTFDAVIGLLGVLGTGIMVWFHPKKEFNRGHGFLLVLAYVLYLVWIVIRG
ncbi:MAG: calcium/sodium antiporter [Candidatus Margulisbacteria bacterium]|nr:calcium/sodium antiporter [Candidatus Margulisiibacteriota bacterium]